MDLWWAPLDVSPRVLRRMASCLSADERRRADRFRRPADRRRFVAARGWMRMLLAQQLDCTPGAVRIVAGEHGKPRLVGSELRFNAARSADVAVYATSWASEVGVDVEAIRSGAELDGVASRFFTRAEQRALACLPAAERQRALFECWTRKEAFGKAIGAGLGFALDAVDVWSSNGRPTVVAGWSIRRIDVMPGFAAAVASSESSVILQSPQRVAQEKVRT